MSVKKQKKSEKKLQSLPRIHYYNTATGYIYYVSEIIAGLDCRVYDAVRTIEDAYFFPEEAWQCSLETDLGKVHTIPQNTIGMLVLESVQVSNRGVDFLDRLMTISPLRDKDKWLNSPDGRKRFMSDRQARLRKWRQAGR
jgi:hypothetical protein